MSNEEGFYDIKYKNWISDIGRRFKRSQIKAASKVNEEMLLFYWELGRDIEVIKPQNLYGTSFYEKISKDLTRELPDVKSFSPRNLRYMNDFYLLYSDAVDLKLVDTELPDSNLQQVVAKSEMKNIFRIPWGHHICILNKCKNNRAKALFFVEKTLDNNWSRAVLMNFLDTNLYEREGKAISNFTRALPTETSDLAQAITKDPYNFDFLALRQDYNEKELKDALMDNVQSFLLELGTGFAFVGREYRLVVGQTEQFIDMLFYNILIHCYVVVEVKVREFMPSDIGQTGTYVEVVNGILRREGDGPTIGLLICKTKDNVLAKYAVNSSSEPIGISEFMMQNFSTESFKSAMPTIEEIEQQLNDSDM